MMAILPSPDEELDQRNPLLITVDNLLSAEECHALIERIERGGVRGKRALPLLSL